MPKPAGETPTLPGLGGALRQPRDDLLTCPPLKFAGFGCVDTKVAASRMTIHDRGRAKENSALRRACAARREDDSVRRLDHAGAVQRDHRRTSGGAKKCR